MSTSLLSQLAPKLYLLTNDDDFELLYRKLEAALATGYIALLQIRRKQTIALSGGAATLHKEAQKLVDLAKTYQVPVVINDDIKLAATLGVGVHLGQQDGHVNDAKQQLLPDQTVGRTCHGKVEWVRQAKDDGATYAAMGAVFASTTKPDATIVTRQQLDEGCQQDIALCVIGGLTAENVVELAGLPITYIAVVGDIMDLPVDKIAARCEQWQQALTKWNAPTD